MKLKEMESIVEGMLFAMGGTVEPSKISKALEVEDKQVVEAIESLKATYKKQNRGITITEINGAYQMFTSPDIYEYLIRIAKPPQKYVLTDVLLETLSIIAYKQPITKSEIEKIRGVSSDFAVSKLVEFGLCAELGRLDAPGRPMLFGTTEEFLRTFGVKSIEELPELSQSQIEEFKLEAENEANNVEVTI